ncbi:MAG: hypothetical protein AAF675_07755 [Pseudomonadota bacterium]
MAEEAGEHALGDPGLDRDGREAVAEIVEAQTRQPRRSAGPEPEGRQLRIDAAVPLAREDARRRCAGQGGKKPAYPLLQPKRPRSALVVRQERAVTLHPTPFQPNSLAPPAACQGNEADDAGQHWRGLLALSQYGTELCPVGAAELLRLEPSLASAKPSAGIASRAAQTKCLGMAHHAREDSERPVAGSAGRGTGERAAPGSHVVARDPVD